MSLIKCNHNWELTERSNVIQYDVFGYPLRMFIRKCDKCGKSEQVWIDVAREELEELDTGESVLLKWSVL